MPVLERLGTSGTALGAVVISTICSFAAVVLLPRVSGPRSLAETSSFDAAATDEVTVVVLRAAGRSVLVGDAPVDRVLLAGVRSSERLR